MFTYQDQFGKTHEASVKDVAKHISESMSAEQLAELLCSIDDNIGDWDFTELLLEKYLEFIAEMVEDDESYEASGSVDNILGILSNFKERIDNQKGEEI